MGITPYFPRVKMPGAPADSSLYISTSKATVSETEVKAHHTEVEVDIDVSPRTSKKTQQPEPASFKRPNIKIQPEQAGDQKGKQKKENSPAINFQLGFVRINSALALIHLVPFQQTSPLNAQQNKLLLNIMHAINVSPIELAVESQTFKWPFSDSPQFEKSKEAACSALRAYLMQKFSDIPFTHLFVFGEKLMDILATEEQGAGAENISTPYKLTFSRSLDEMLHHGGLKKEAWLIFRNAD